MHLTTAQILARADERLTITVKRAGMYRAQALAKRGDGDNMTLARRVDALNDHCADIVSTTDDLLVLAGDIEGSRILHRLWQGATTALLTMSGECIDAAMPLRVPA